MADSNVGTPSPAKAGAQAPAPDWAPAFAGEGKGAEFVLIAHAGHSASSFTGISISVKRSGDDLVLRFSVGGHGVLWPAQAHPTRTDNLWRTTCFEMFLRFDDDERYVEFNFSPSTQWAAYAFDGYREGMTVLDITPPVIERMPDGIAVTLDLTGLPRGELAMALTAVIEEEGGIKSYWSLAHPPGAPDFHHPACFAARLPAPDAP